MNYTCTSTVQIRPPVFCQLQTLPPVPLRRSLSLCCLLPVSLSRCLAVSLSRCSPPDCLSVCLSVCPSACHRFSVWVSSVDIVRLQQSAITATTAEGASGGQRHRPVQVRYKYCTDLCTGICTYSLLDRQTDRRTDRRTARGTNTYTPQRCCTVLVGSKRGDDDL